MATEHSSSSSASVIHVTETDINEVVDSISGHEEPAPVPLDNMVPGDEVPGHITMTTASGEVPDDEPETTPSGEKSLLRRLFTIIWWLWCLGVYGGLSLGIYKSISMISDAKQYQKYGTEEQCLITARDSSSCRYKSNGRYKYRTKYAYEAMVYSKCGNETLFSYEYDNDDCPGTYKEIGSETKCYVLDCDEKEFSFYSSTSKYVWGILILIACSFASCCFFYCFCYKSDSI